MADFIKAKCKASPYGVKISGKAQDICDQIMRYANERGYINLELKQRREVGTYGDTHFLQVDTWQPANTDVGQRASNYTPTHDIPQSNETNEMNWKGG